MVTLVTGYVRLNGGHRSHERYLQLGRRLIGLGLPTVCFYDGPAADVCPTPKTEVRPASLESCWLYRASRGAAPPGGNPAKDTVDYCVVQHQKSAWLAEVARFSDGPVVWVDFGILHLPVTDKIVRDFIERVAAAPPARIALPAIWPMGGRPLIDWTRPAWYVAGGVVVMPADQGEWFHGRCRDYATLQIETSRRSTWEVNTWAAVVRDHRDRFDRYRSDHDATLLTGYGGPPP